MPWALNVLVVDDEPLCSEVVMRALKRERRIVTRSVAYSAESALQMIDGGYRPDLIVTDFHMPGMTGAGLVRALRARHIEVPVVLVSAEAKVNEDFEIGDFAAFIRKGAEYGGLLLATVRDQLGLIEPDV